MSPIILFFVLSLLMNSLSLEGKPANNINSRITVMGFVYCDVCSNNSFSKHSYFMPGAEVKIDCRFGAISSKTREQISFSVNRTTNKHGVYKLEIPSVDGFRCAEAVMASSCQASLMWSSSAKCNVPGHRTTSDEIEIKSKQDNLCIYSLTALYFQPSKTNINLCRN